MQVMRTNVGLSSSSPSPRIVVIGGGAGGLAAAGRLGRSGFNVTILEKNGNVGGRMQSEYIDGWRFDTGPSLLLFPQKYHETFQALGVSNVQSSLTKISPAAYRVFFPDTAPAQHIDLLYNVDDMSSQLESIEPGAGDAYRRFLAMAVSHLQLGVPNFIDRDFKALEDAKGLMDLLPNIKSINPWQLLGPTDWVLRQGFFKNSRIRAALTFQNLYVGLSPATAPAVFTLLAGTELTDGVWYPIGGFGTIRDKLKKAVQQQCNVDIQTHTRVSNIVVENIDPGENGATKVVGVRVERQSKQKEEHEEEFIPADIVLSNQDLPVTYTTDGFVSPSTRNTSLTQYVHSKAKNSSKLKYSNGIIAYNWCVQGKLPRLLHHNVFLSDDTSNAWRPASAPDEFVLHPNIYVHVPSKTDPSAAPEGCDSVMVLLPTACLQNDNFNRNEQEIVNEGRRRIFQIFRNADIGEVEGMIKNEFVITPSEWKQRYNLQYGAAFGLSHGLDQLSLFRPGNKEDERRINGLYFVGASTRPGNGVPLCFIGAKLVAERIKKEWMHN